MKVFCLLAVVVLAGSGCSSDGKEAQIERACILVNGWPVDYASVWPAVVESSIPNGKSAGEEMASAYLQPVIDQFEITDPTAGRIAREYKEYWRMLEREVIATGALPNADSPSLQLLASLQEECAPYDDYQ